MDRSRKLRCITDRRKSKNRHEDPLGNEDTAMFRNYLVTALRNIVRHKLYSFINIAGLTVGLACVIFVILFVRSELSYDKWIPDTQDLYRIELSVYVPAGDPLDMAVIPFPMPAAMRDEIPEVTRMTRLNARRSLRSWEFPWAVARCVRITRIISDTFTATRP